MNDLNPRPQVRTQQARPARTQVQAQQGSYLAAMPADNSSLSGLVQGLSALNPVLQKYAQQRLEETGAEADIRAKAAAQHVEQPRDALTGLPTDVPKDVPPAFDGRYRAAFAGALAQRVALETKSDVVRRFNEEKDAEGFVPDDWLARERQKAMAGVKDPRLVAALGEHFTEVEQGIRYELNRAAVEKHEENKLTSAFTIMGGLGAELSPAELATRYQQGILPQLDGLRMDKKQAASMFVARLKAISTQGEDGRPEVFDALDIPDAEGHSILARNPQLQQEVMQAREHAKLIRERRIHKDTEDDRARSLMKYEDDIRDMPELVTQDRLLADIGPHGLSSEKASDLWRRSRAARAEKAANANLMADAENGKLGFWDPKDQNRALDALLGGQARALWDAAVAGQGDQVKALAGVLMARHSQSGATVPIDSLARFMETSITNLPDSAGPSQKFLATAEVYKALAADKGYRSLYFKDKVAEVMDTFDRHTRNGVDAATAYKAAYRSVDPEFQAMAKKRAQTPEMQEKVRKLAVKYTEGSTMWGWVGGNGRPENVETLNTWAAGEVRRLLETNPDLTDGELHDHIERHSQQNFVLDTTTQLAIKVPPQLASAMTQEALASYSKELIAHHKLGDEAKVRYVPLNDQGLYEVQYWVGSRVRAEKGQINLPDLLNRFRASKTLSPDEGTQLKAWRDAIKAGKEPPELDPGLIHKGRSVGYLSGSDVDTAEQRSLKKFRDRVGAAPDLGFGRPNMNEPVPPRKGPAKVDHQVTSRLAGDLAFGPGALRDHNGLAASLIALREGVVLSVHPDPNPAAGMNLGAGYNLKANAKWIDQDLKRAGVPEDRIEDVKAGRASLTPENVKRLIQVSLPRYEESTRKAAEEAAPGLWNRMTPQQRAVMVDISYQVGSASEFKRAWQALEKGDTKAFQLEVATHFRNSNGEMVEDTRARDLRASMLMGPSHWNARISHVGRIPTTSLQASRQ